MWTGESIDPTANAVPTGNNPCVAASTCKPVLALEVFPSSAPLAPVAAPVPPATEPPIPVPTPIPPSVLPLLASSKFSSNGLTLMPNDSDVGPEQRSFDWAAAMNFIVRNDSSDTLNFQFDSSSFTLKLSDGTSYNGRPDNHVLTQFRPGDEMKVRVVFGPEDNWSSFSKRLASPQVSSYEISVHNFAPRLSDARWHKDVQH